MNDNLIAKAKQHPDGRIEMLEDVKKGEYFWVKMWNNPIPSHLSIGDTTPLVGEFVSPDTPGYKVVEDEDE